MTVLPSPDRFTADVGPYVLDALAGPERAAFEAHVATCEACRLAVDEVAALPALLDLVPPEVVGALAGSSGLGADVGSPTDHDGALGDPPARLLDDLAERRDPGPPPTLLAHLLQKAEQEARRTRRRRVWGGGLAAAAVVALTVALSTGVLQLSGLGSPPEPTSPSVAVQAIELTAVVETPVSADVRMEPTGWGTRIDLTCRYGAAGADGADYGDGSGSAADPDPEAPEDAYADEADGASYSLVVRDSSGRSEEVATWGAVPGTEMHVPASTSMPYEDIVEIELRGTSGEPLLRALL